VCTLGGGLCGFEGAEACAVMLVDESSEGFDTVYAE
jgi:hypothetical protein